MTYEEMLDEAYGQIPPESLKKERFEMPRLQTMVQGNKTIIVNFSKIIKDLQREEKHALKYFTSQAASAANIEGGRMILKGVFSQQELQGFLEDYIRRFVLCRECSRPDTKITEQKGVKILKCSACGAFTAIKE
ncbi:MAG: translation initiation factor IF-2 subunit beta [Candidatus Diapherotrites archaeon]|nr:translation initiation factor IF-2 subunit beta [Candidatus Diapherotrites archaeon]